MTGDPSRRKMMPVVIPGMGSTDAAVGSGARDGARDGARGGNRPPAAASAATRRPAAGQLSRAGQMSPAGHISRAGQMSRPSRGEQESFRKFSASQLYCPKCKEAMPVREKLLLVLPSGNLYDYTCVKCGESLGSKTTKE